MVNYVTQHAQVRASNHQEASVGANARVRLESLNNSVDMKDQKRTTNNNSTGGSNIPLKNL